MSHRPSGVETLECAQTALTGLPSSSGHASFALFDLDDTLVDRGRAFPECVRGFCQRFGLGADVEAWLREAMYERAYQEDFARLREEFAVSTPVEELWLGYCDVMARAVSCAPEALEGLERLGAAGWRLWAVTNGAGDIQRAKLARTGLLPLFDAVCISEEVGVRKPAAGMFEAAGRMLRVEDLERGGWMVGDSLEKDVLGGRAVGLRTVWVTAETEPGTADHCVRSVAQAVDLMLNEGGAGCV
ncbi:HAD family hydrolase [Streptomyces sp. NPDC058459]|uniref:HAD family hydrolase n=1 Tax=Streptomyces sp. NPDC058459 TaxID=3346508 RepID=UPI00364936DE